MCLWAGKMFVEGAVKCDEASWDSKAQGWSDWCGQNGWNVRMASAAVGQGGKTGCTRASESIQRGKRVSEMSVGTSVNGGYEAIRPGNDGE